MISIFQAVLGFLLLVLGRKLYWLFVGVVGFVLGVSLGMAIFPTESELVLIAVAVIAGVIGSILANVAQRLAIAIAGFFVGGYLIQYVVLDWMSISMPVSDILVFFIGGILGIILILLLFDWALVILSSFFGAYLLVKFISLDSILQLFVFAVLCLIGIMIQSREISNH
jgi:hypothetical protein